MFFFCLGTVHRWESYPFFIILSFCEKIICFSVTLILIYLGMFGTPNNGLLLLFIRTRRCPVYWSRFKGSIGRSKSFIIHLQAFSLIDFRICLCFSNVSKRISKAPLLSHKFYINTLKFVSQLKQSTRKKFGDMFSSWLVLACFCNDQQYEKSHKFPSDTPQPFISCNHLSPLTSENSISGNFPLFPG